MFLTLQQLQSLVLLPSKGWIQFRNDEEIDYELIPSHRYLKENPATKTNGKWCIKIDLPIHQAYSIISHIGFYTKTINVPPMELTLPTLALIQSDQSAANTIILRFDRQFEESRYSRKIVRDFIQQLASQYYSMSKTHSRLKVTISIGHRLDVLSNAMTSFYNSTPEWKRAQPKFIAFYSSLNRFHYTISMDHRIERLPDEEYYQSPTYAMPNLIIQLLSVVKNNNLPVEKKKEFIQYCENESKMQSLELQEPFIQLFKLTLVSATTYALSTYFFPEYKTVPPAMTMIAGIAAGHFFSLPNKLGHSALEMTKHAIDMVTTPSLIRKKVQHV